MIKSNKIKMRTENTCGHCAVVNPSNGYCKRTGKYVNALSTMPCFVEKSDFSDQMCVAKKRPVLIKYRSTADRTEKLCTACGRTLPIDSFGIARRSKDGHNYYCLECIRERDRKRRSRKKETTQ